MTPDHPMVRHASTITVVLLTVVVGIMVLSQGFITISDVSEANTIQSMNENITELQQTDDAEGNFIGGSALRTVMYGNSRVYVGGNLAFAYYDIATNLTHDLLMTDTGDWLAGEYVVASTYDSNHNGLFIIALTSTLDTPRFGYYNESSNTTDEIASPLSVGGLDMAKIRFVPTKNSVLIATQEQFLIYNMTDGSFTDLAPFLDGHFSAGNGSYVPSNVADMDYDPNLHIALISSQDGEVVQYNLSDDSALNLPTDGDGQWMVRYNDDGMDVFHTDDKIRVYNREENMTVTLFTAQSVTGTPFSQDIFADYAGMRLFEGVAGGLVGYYDFDEGFAFTDIQLLNDDAQVSDVASFTIAPNGDIYMVGNPATFIKYTHEVEGTEPMSVFNLMLGITFLIAGIVVISVIGKRMIS